MTEFWHWLWGLDRFPAGGEGPLSLQWGVELPAWLLLGMGLLVLAAIMAFYRREAVTGGRRGLLILLRFGLVGLVVAVLCRPSLVRQRDRTERAYVNLLVDTSSSMAVEDGRGSNEAAGQGGTAVPAGGTPRFEQIRKALVGDDAAALRALLDRNALMLGRFDGSAETIGAGQGISDADELARTIAALQPAGHATSFTSALGSALERTQGRRLAAVILATDGRRTDASDLRDLLELARGRRVPIHVVPVGSPVGRPDVEVGPLRADALVFLDDLVAVEAMVRGRGLTGASQVTVRILDDVTGESLEARQVELDGPEAEVHVEFEVKPGHAGLLRYRVSAEPLSAEVVLDNNSDRIDVMAREDRLRVLYVEGYPRYEYRYLKNALLREETAALSVLLLEADPDFVQEGADPVRRFPDTPEELQRFDVVLFGDVDPRAGWITPGQMNMLLDFVGHQGGGFGLIAGERYAPERFAGTPLEKLLPVNVERRRTRSAQEVGPFQPVLTDEGLESRVMRSLWNGADDEGEAGRPMALDHLPALYWSAAVGGAKPGATVLAVHPTATVVGAAGVDGEDRRPVLVVGRFGAGQILFQGTDDTWRWRRHSGEFLHDTYWVRLARFLMRPAGGEGGEWYRLWTDQRGYDFGEPVQVELEVRDPRALSAAGEKVVVAVYEAADAWSGGEEGVAAEAGLTPPVARLELSRIGSGAERFEGTFLPSRSGQYVLRLDSATGTGSMVGREHFFRVREPGVENLRLEADPEGLAEIAAATGGRVFAVDKLAEEFASIPDRSVRHPDDIVEPLWDTPLVMLLFVLLAGTEWGLRKWFGLL